MIQPFIEPRAAVVEVSGEVDIASAPRLAEVLTECLDRACAMVWVDLAQVTFMDSSGVHVLVRSRLDAEERGAELRLSRCSASAERILVLAGVPDLLPTGEGAARSATAWPSSSLVSVNRTAVYTVRLPDEHPRRLSSI